MMFPDQDEDESTGSNKAAVTFNILDITKERVVEMPDARPNPDCGAESDLACALSFDKLQLIEFIRETFR